MNQSVFKMFPKDAEHIALSDGRLVENSRCGVLHPLAKAQELRVPLGWKRAFDTSEVIHGSAADLTFDCLVTIKHRESKCHPVVVVTQRPTPRQRHRKFSPTPPANCGIPQVLSRGAGETASISDIFAEFRRLLSDYRTMNDIRRIDLIDGAVGVRGKKSVPDGAATNVACLA
jgi:hypothetical protein